MLIVHENLKKGWHAAVSLINLVMPHTIYSSNPWGIDECNSTPPFIPHLLPHNLAKETLDPQAAI